MVNVLDKFILFLVDKFTFTFFTSYLLFFGLVLVLAITPVFFAFKSSSRLIKWGTLILSIAFVSIILITNPIYASDLSVGGSKIEGVIFENKVTDSISTKYSNYDGLIFFALPQCKYCHSFATKLDLVKSKYPNINILTILYTDDHSDINFFKEYTGVHNLQIETTYDQKSMIDFTKGKFPYLYLVKKGVLVHKWNNNQMGFKSLDWIVKNQIKSN